MDQWVAWVLRALAAMGIALVRAQWYKPNPCLEVSHCSWLHVCLQSQQLLAHLGIWCSAAFLHHFLVRYIQQPAYTSSRLLCKSAAVADVIAAAAAAAAVAPCRQPLPLLLLLLLH
jgi:hypothetical protein